MIGLAFVSALIGVAPGAQAGTAAVRRTAIEVTVPPAASAVPGQYIVTLKPGALSSGVMAPSGVRPLYIYERVINGFTARMTLAQLNEMRTHPDVAAIEQDAVARAVDVPRGFAGPITRVPPAAPTTSWGLDRIDQRRLPLNRVYNAAHTGAGVTAYIVDSGIDKTNSQFTGRIAPGYSTVDDGNGTNDCLGHGTMTAGIVGGTTWGVARSVKLSPVRVLGCDGFGTFSQIIAGFDWVAAHAVKPAVANMSLGGPKSAAANAAATALADSGVFVSVAAGNSADDACDFSPAGASRVLTVGASAGDDTLSGFSNVGPCVDLFAPGTDVVSARMGGGSAQGSGTSFASPYVAGVGALFKQTYGDYPTATVLKWINDASTSGVLKGLHGANDRLLYTAGL
ncbi:S8 family peptidase [Sphaerisporangium album]|uniref:S8 family peptidase n=1 Tax=Sphaerisporangium album TaxID=509200 RepID=UPI0015F01EC9|nr:S8 family peptidase [Sphaerisporangium album]